MKVSCIVACGVITALIDVSQAATILVDFGTTATGSDAVNGKYWNDVISNTGGQALVDSTNTATSVTIAVANATGSNVQGTTSPTGDALAHGYTSSITSDSLYASGSTVINITLNGLDTSSSYTFYIFASRANIGETSYRPTDYTITGNGASTVLTLETRNNTGTLVTTSGIIPTSNGTVTIGVSKRAGNVADFFYIGALEITSSPVPEPASMGLLALGGGLLLRRRVR